MIHPFEERYRTSVADLFEEEARIGFMVDVEVALAHTHYNLGLLTEDEYHSIREGARSVTAQKVKNIEKMTHHDIMALVQALTEASGCDKVHIGATSQDINDSALGLQMKKANEVILQDLHKLKDILLKKAEETKHLVCIGRTHGQHALPMTYGLRFALWAYEVNEVIEDLSKTKFYGKMKGAVGTYASFAELNENGVEVERNVLTQLGLEIPLVANQVVPRLFIAKYLFNLISTACLIEKIGNEIRNLQRTEIMEVGEPFGSKQTGSSTMPHKRNPHKSENLCALAKRLRTNILPALENISLEHERDLTNSANERIIIPETIILTHYMILQAVYILKDLEFFEENIKGNLLKQPDILMEKRMMQLIKEGYGRQEAYQAAKKTLYEANVPSSYLGLAVETTENVIEVLR
ncbi:MAG: adenylosuccinate lyase [Candidatus Heimdallarchaeota archaeon]